MMKAREILRNAVLALMALCASSAIAQVDAQLTHYWATPAYYNAAALGETDFIHITAGSRLQWLGVEHAPMSFFGMADMPFKFLNKRWGAGVVLQHERMGLYHSINAGAQLAWKKKLFKGMLSVGLQVGFINETFKGSDIFIPEGDEAHTSADEAIPNTDVSGTAIDLSAGVFYSHKWFWVGASVNHITEPKVTLKANQESDDEYEFEAGRMYYFMAGSNIPIKNTLFEIQPSVFVKSDFHFFQAEATMRMRYNKFITAGVGYRWKDAVMAMIGVEFKNFYIGYAYDYPLTTMSKVTKGSHELVMSYNVKLDMKERNKNKQKSIRIM
ncbi:MAG: type IX secretion system membrane protein PorP/SprF [Muribaculaceae bacterium]|nr:type IX secretion system membrane protein PorP/SprF [Muribaculaceae bacterium]